jgi:membrane fusion protein (multidrug efflux system)
VRPAARRQVWRSPTIAAVAIATTTVACSHRQNAQSPAAVPTVATSTARLDTLRDTLTASGTVVPALSADWTVVAPEPARIVELPHAEGDVVKPGDLLVRFDIPAIDDELTARQAEVAQAATKLTVAKTDLAKMTTLADQGIISRNQLDVSKGAVIDAQTALTSAQGQLDRANAALAHTKVVARFGGTIVKRWHQEGDEVSPADADPIMRIVDPTRLQIAVPLSLAEYVRVEPGQHATVIGVPGSPGEAAIVAMRPAPSSASATTVEARLAFTQPTTLTADTSVEVEIVLEERANVIVVPRVAVQKDDDGTYVMVFGADGRVHRKEARLGLTTRDQAQIVTGIAFGDRVVTSTPMPLVDGMVVQVEK